MISRPGGQQQTNAAVLEQLIRELSDGLPRLEPAQARRRQLALDNLAAYAELLRAIDTPPPQGGVRRSPDRSRERLQGSGSARASR